jgi:hypothetical protein
MVSKQIVFMQIVFMIALATPAGCIKPDVAAVIDAKTAVGTLEQNGGEWTPDITRAVDGSLGDKDWRIQARGLVAVSNFPDGGPEQVRKLVEEVCKANPEIPGAGEALTAIGQP